MSDFLIEKSIRLKIAEDLARDNLPRVNAEYKKVRPKRSFYSLFIKRILDILISFTALLITLPLNMIFALCTYCDVGSPILFRQQRVGKKGRLFELVKFRNMTNETDSQGELLPPERRITRFGSFMRKTSMDELLNFWSILKGDMSIIGPRPLLPEYTMRYSKRHKARLAVKPGLECPYWKDIDHILTWDDQFENDVWYVEHVSFLVDCQMIVKLIKFALDRKSARARADVGRGIFMGYSADGKAISLSEVDNKYFEKYNIERIL